MKENVRGFVCRIPYPHAMHGGLQLSALHSGLTHELEQDQEKRARHMIETPGKQQGSKLAIENEGMRPCLLSRVFFLLPNYLPNQLNVASVVHFLTCRPKGQTPRKTLLY
ncbi:hypothetical protein OPV22_007381 [Ensete ventricosum]|uniref:Uncharacterized protein n=1 Tax=Ensete ventricosum TaxID=4639 RepID=A0AAV8RT24_ENSVE|nr:hypothetical protein OPV22_007381 [Ensete ventricosum]